MNEADFIFILQTYGLTSSAIAAVSAAAALIAEKIFKNRFPRILLNYLPVIISLVAALVYDMAAVKKCFCLSAEAFYSGLAAGSLGTAFVAAVKKLKRGENVPLEITVLFVEGLLEGYLEGETKTAVAKAVASVLANGKNEKREISARKIRTILTKNCKDVLTPSRISALAETLLVGQNASGKEK